jgi:nucleoside-diphosphate-sugar epimerase
MHLTDRVIVTGATSGLGKYIVESNDNFIGLTRANRKKIMNGFYNNSSTVIIHCAFNNSVDIKDYYKYVDDNILLTKELSTLPHRKFIYLSSINVYREENSAYKLSKLFAESIVESDCNNPLIIRSSAILGKAMRYNSFLKILKEKNPSLSLSGDSTFNYILQSDLCDFILSSVTDNIVGTYNFTSCGNITLKDLAIMFESSPNFGNYLYDTPEVSNQDLKKYCGFANKTCKSVIKEFRESYEY